MLDQKTIELLEGKVFETLQIDKPSESGTASLYKEVSKNCRPCNNYYFARV